MADISKCEGLGCALRDNCYRYTAKPDGTQTYLVDVPYDNVLKSCEMYWGPPYELHVFYNGDMDEIFLNLNPPSDDLIAWWKENVPWTVYLGPL